MNKIAKIGAGIAVLLALSNVTACSEDPASSSSTTLDVSNASAIIDVRTPAEYAAGHLERAVELNLMDVHFAEGIVQFDPKGFYVLYCSTQSCADTAVDGMKKLGFTNVVNLGTLQNAAARTALPIVK